MNIKSDAILKMLELNNYKEKYTEEDLKKITSLKIDMDNINNNPTYIDYQELALLSNLKELTLDNIIIEETLINCIEVLPNLTSLYLLNCETATNLENLAVDNCDFEFNTLKEIIIQNLTLKNINCPPLYFSTHTLCLINCNIKSLDILSSINTNTLIINNKSYLEKEKEFASLTCKIIILEDSTDNILKEMN